MAKKKKKEIEAVSEKPENEKGLKVENEDAVRDPNSGAIIFNNQSAYQQAVRRKRQGTTNKVNDGEIRSLKKQVAQLAALVDSVINSKK